MSTDGNNEHPSALATAVEFFSGANKQLRERWVCQELLRSLGVDFAEAEVVSSTDEPPDVVFKDARFEIKEVLNEGRKRHAEYKQALAKALDEASVGLPVSEHTPKDITPLGVAKLVEATLSEFETHYPAAVRAQLDALLYVNLAEHWLTEGAMPESSRFERCGWRSVSAVFGGRDSFVFFANERAPEFLRAREGGAFSTSDADA